MAFWTKKSEFSPASAPESRVASVSASVTPTLPSASGQAKNEAKELTPPTATGAPTSPVAAAQISAGQSAPRGLVRTAIGAGTKIQGKLSFDTPVQIDGQVNGEIFSSKHLIIGASAQVEANLIAPSVTVLGIVTGEISAAERLEIKVGAAVNGAISTSVLVLEEGGRLNASVSMGLEALAQETLAQRVQKSSGVERTTRAAPAVTPQSPISIDAQVPSNLQVH